LLLELLAPDLRYFAQDILVVGVCLAAFVWGGGPERVVAASWLLIFELPMIIYRAAFGGDFQLTHVDLVLATTDLLAGGVWILIALYANRSYTLWIAGLQILAISAHLARGMAESISPIAYVTMVVAPGWLQLFLLAGGVLFHVRRKRRFGDYRDWRFSLGSGEQLRPRGIDQWVVSIANRGSAREAK
jgi:hypothetical protein